MSENQKLNKIEKLLWGLSFISFIIYCYIPLFPIWGLISLVVILYGLLRWGFDRKIIFILLVSVVLTLLVYILTIIY